MKALDAALLRVRKLEFELQTVRVAHRETMQVLARVSSEHHRLEDQYKELLNEVTQLQGLNDQIQHDMETYPRIPQQSKHSSRRPAKG